MIILYGLNKRFDFLFDFNVTISFQNTRESVFVLVIAESLARILLETWGICTDWGESSITNYDEVQEYRTKHTIINTTVYLSEE